MRVLVVTKIFPNSAEPLSSPFNRQQFGALRKLCDLEILATIPWFPGAAVFRHWSAAGRLVGVPEVEELDGIRVRHPRFLYLPKLGRSLSGPLYAASLLRQAFEFRGRVDVILGSWAYPDGYAAIMLSELVGAPAVVKLHGSDLDVVARLPGPERRLRRALPRAARVVAVSRSLCESAVRLGVASSRIDVVPNGVDSRLFKVRDRLSARRALGLDVSSRMLLYVGRLSVEKGVLNLIEAFASASAKNDDLELVLVGDGPARELCLSTARSLKTPVTLVGAQPFERIPDWMAASDAVVLPSHHEGMPNVVVEALACGRRVVATRVGAIPELIDSELLGELVPARNIKLLADALERVASAPYDPTEVSARASGIDWPESAARLYASLERARADWQAEQRSAA